MSNIATLPVPIPVSNDNHENETDGRIDLTEAFKLRYKHGLSYQQIADRFGVTKQAVHQRLTNISQLLPNHEEIETYRQSKAQMLDALEYKVYNEMLDPEKLKAASFNNLAYGFQNISTQNRLEKGLMTEKIDITVSASKIDDLRRRENELIKTIEARVVQDVVPNDTSTKS